MSNKHVSEYLNDYLEGYIVKASESKFISNGYLDICLMNL